MGNNSVSEQAVIQKVCAPNNHRNLHAGGGSRDAINTQRASLPLIWPALLCFAQQHTAFMCQQSRRTDHYLYGIYRVLQIAELRLVFQVSWDFRDTL
jgi:hypothetical protein